MLSNFKAPGGIPEERLAWSQLALGLGGGILIACLPLLFSNGAALAEPSMKNLGLFAAYPLTLLLGLAFLGLQFYCARQWVEGKPLVAAGAIALCACIGLAVWSWAWARQTEEKMSAFKAETLVLREVFAFQKGNFGEVRVYMYGRPAQELLDHYLDLGRPVFSEKHLAAEPQGQIGMDAPQRVFIVRREDAARAEKDYGVTEAEGQASLFPETGAGFEGTKSFVLLGLPQDKDWPAQAAAALAERQQKPQE